MTREELFWAKVRKDDDGCWRWIGSLRPNGYGQFNAGNGKIVKAHRFAYQAVKGAIPVGLVLDHLCGHRECVNPDHLEAVSQRVNLLRGNTVQGNVARTGRCKNGHILTAENMYMRRDRPGTWNCLDCHHERRQRKRLFGEVDGVLYVYAVEATR